MPLTLEKIRSRIAWDATYQKAVHYHKAGRVKELSVQTGSDSDTFSLSALVQGQQAYHVAVSWNGTGDILTYSCECPAHQTYAGLCKHAGAALLTVYAKERESEKPQPVKPPAQTPAPRRQAPKRPPLTDGAIASLILKYQREAQEELENAALPQTQRVRLIPTLNLEKREQAYLTFSVGRDRLYIVRDLDDFCAAVRNGSTLTYGKHLAFRHSLCSFDEESQKLLNLLLQNRESQWSRNYARRQLADQKKPMLLTPQLLDRFFEWSLGKEIRTVTAWGEQTLLFQDRPVSLSVALSQASGGITLNATGFQVFFGEQFSYLLKEHFFTRLPSTENEFSHTFLRPLLEKKGRLFILQADLEAFQEHAVPVLKEHLTFVGQTELLKPFEPEPFESELYLDILSPNELAARLLFRYPSAGVYALEETDYPHLKRNRREEWKQTVLVSRYFPENDSKTFQFKFSGDDDGIYDFLKNGLPILEKQFPVFASEAFQRIGTPPSSHASIGVSVSENLMALELGDRDFDLPELSALLASYRLRKRYIRLRGGQFLSLEDIPLKGIAKLADSLDLSRKELSQLEKGALRLPLHRFIQVDALLKEEKELNVRTDQGFRVLAKRMENAGNGDFPIPKSLENTLRGYQKTGYQWLKTMELCGFSGILADDMGLGKSLQMIAVLLSLKELGTDAPLPSLIVCPTSLVLNWADEFAKFAPSMRILCISGTQQQRMETIPSIALYDAAIVSYDLLKRDTALFAPISFAYVIIDEAQSIKNPETQAARAVKALNGRFRCALTGTPVENRASELWSIFDFLMPGYLLSYNKFKSRYEIPIVRNQDEAALRRLHTLAAPFLLRRMKRDVLTELPEKTEIDLYVEMEEEQQKLYLANALLGVQQFSTGGANDRIAILAHILRMRQLCCDPKLCYEDFKGPSGKLEACVRLLQDAYENGHKVLLFSQFTSMLDILRERLAREGIKTITLEGATPQNKRHDLVKEFQEGKTDVFLISLKAGGTGLNLTAADVVVHYDPWWNLAAQNQATDRAYRIGQKQNVTVYRLLAKGTIEERICKLQQSKKELADSLVTEGEGILEALTRDELLKLF